MQSVALKVAIYIFHVSPNLKEKKKKKKNIYMYITEMYVKKL